MVSNYLKRLVLACLCAAASAAVLFFGSSLALAGDPPCDPPTVQPTGPLARGDATPAGTYDIVPGSSFRVSFSCSPGSAAGLTSSEGLQKGPVAAGRTTTGGPVPVGGDRLTLKLHGAESVSFSGSTEGSKVGETKTFSFFDGTGMTYTVTLRFVDAYATAGALGAVAKTASDASSTAQHAEAEAARAHKRIDDLPSPEGSRHAVGYFRLGVGGGAMFRTGQFEAAGAAELDTAYVFAPPGNIAGLVQVSLGWDRLSLPIKARDGVPLNVDEVFQDSFNGEILGGVNLPAVKEVDFELSGGFALSVKCLPGVPFGQEVVNGHVWSYDPQATVIPGAALRLGVVFHPAPGWDISLHEMATLPFVLSENMDGKEKDVFAAQFLSLLTLGGQLEVTKDPSSSSTEVGTR